MHLHGDIGCFWEKAILLLALELQDKGASSFHLKGILLSLLAQ